MANYINRPRYLQQLIERRDNGEVKIITGSRRCGKSWLLSHIYKDYLLTQGVREECIVSVSFDTDEEGGDLMDPGKLKAYLREHIANDDENYYELTMVLINTIFSRLMHFPMKKNASRS